MVFLSAFFDVRLAEADCLRDGWLDDDDAFDALVVEDKEMLISIGSGGITDDGDGSSLTDVVLSAVATGLNAPGCRRVVDDTARFVACFLGRSSLLLVELHVD